MIRSMRACDMMIMKVMRGSEIKNDEIGDVIMSSQGQPTRCLTSAPNRQTLTDEFYQWGQGYHASSILLRIARKLSQTKIEALAFYLSYANYFLCATDCSRQYRRNFGVRVFQHIFRRGVCWLMTVSIKSSQRRLTASRTERKHVPPRRVTHSG